MCTKNIVERVRGTNLLHKSGRFEILNLSRTFAKPVKPANPVRSGMSNEKRI